jgi:hypothetical protein
MDESSEIVTFTLDETADKCLSQAGFMAVFARAIAYGIT